MRKLRLLLSFSIFVNIVNATVFIDETFNYSVTNLASETSWTTEGTLTTGTGRNITSTALTYSNGDKTYILSGVGKTLSSDISVATDYKSYKSFTSTPISSGSVYMSFLYNAGIAQGQTQSEVMGMADGTSQGPRIWAGKGLVSTDKVRFGLTRGSTTGASIIWDTKEFSVTETILLVIKYDFGTSTASVFINSVIGSTSEPTADIVDNTSTTIRTKLDNLWFRSQGSSKAIFSVGGIRIATSWAEVMTDKNTPKLMAPAVGSATDITGEGFTANWSTVENAQSYDVKVYQSTSLAGTFNAAGGGTSSLGIIGLLPNTTYTYTVIAKGDGANYNNSEESAASSSFTTLNSGVASILTDFGDGTWGTVYASTDFTSGNYPTYSANGFNFIKAYLNAGSITCNTGEKHTNRVLLGKSSEGAAFEFPLLSTVGEVEIHATTGTEAMSFRLEEYVGTQWQILGTYETRKSPDSIYTIPVLRNAVTKLRIANNTSSGLFIYKILTRTFQEASELTLRTSSPTEGEVAYSNLKNSITLTYNKNVEKVNGTILLNGVAISLSSCTINDNVVSIPVMLENIPGSNKNYTLIVSAGCFAEVGNETNLSQAINLNFQTLKAVVIPSNYSSQLDVLYKNVGSTNTRLDVYYPTSVSSPVPVLINIHGGGWSGGFKEDQGGFNMYFNQGYVVANVEYRLRGETLAPAAVEDVRGAMNYLLNHAAELNIDVNKVIFQGGSAGGHLALMGGYLQNNRIYDNECVQYPNPFKIIAVIDKYGPCDFSQIMTYSSLISWTGSRFTDQAFLNSLSPIEYVTANTPPTYIIHGDADPTIPYSQSVTLQAALQNAGVKNKFTTVPDGVHGGFPTAYNTQMETEIIQFLSEVLSNTTSIKTQNNSIATLTVSNKTVNSSESGDFEIFNTQGIQVFNAENVKTISFNLSSGMYIVRFSNAAGKQMTQKISIK